MKKGLLKKKTWVMIRTTDEFEKFLSEVDGALEARMNKSNKENTFNDWVNHYYKHLLRDLGPSNGWLLS